MRDSVLAPVYWTCLWDSFGVPVYGTLAIPYAILHVRALNRVTCLGPALGTCLWDWGGFLFMVLGIFTVALILGLETGSLREHPTAP